MNGSNTNICGLHESSSRDNDEKGRSVAIRSGQNQPGRPDGASKICRVALTQTSRMRQAGLSNSKRRLNMSVIQQTRKNPPLLLILSLNFPIENIRGDIDKLLKTIKCPVKACMHGKRMIAYVIVTHEDVDQLRERVKDTIEELSGIEDYMLFPGPNPDDVRGRAGRMNPLAHWLRVGWVENRQLGRPKDVPDRQRWKR
jgi:hypothetical protein